MRQRLEIEFRPANIEMLMCNCNKVATLMVFCPPSDYAAEDGFVCVCCEFCKPSAVRTIDRRELLPIVAA